MEGPIGLDGDKLNKQRNIRRIPHLTPVTDDSANLIPKT